MICMSHSHPLPSRLVSPSTARPEFKPRKRRIRADDEHRKRGRYISRAYEVYKRRKLKCNGQEPCQRCIERADDCSYLVDGLPASNVADGNASAPIKGRSPWTEGLPVQDVEPDESTAMDEELAIKYNIALKTGLRESLELLQGIGEEEAVRLAQVYEEILGALHPIIDFEVLRSHMQHIFSTLESGTHNNLVSSAGEASLNILVLIVAIALLSEGKASRLLSAKLFSSVRYALDYRIHANNIEINGQILMVLAARSGSPSSFTHSAGCSSLFNHCQNGLGSRSSQT